MPAIVHDIGALERLELVRALVLVHGQPQREERVDHGLLAGELDPGQLQRDAEPLALRLLEDLGVALERERHLLLHRRAAAAPVALRLHDLEVVLVRIVVVLVTIVAVLHRDEIGDRRRIGRRVDHLEALVEDRIDHLGLARRRIVIGVVRARLRHRGLLEPHDTVDRRLDLHAPDRLEPVLRGDRLEREALGIERARQRRQPRRREPLARWLVVVLGVLGVTVASQIARAGLAWLCPRLLRSLGHTRDGERRPQLALLVTIERASTSRDHDPAREVAAPRLQAGELHWDRI